MATRFSVLIPTYNRQEHVRQAIESILSQTFTDYELFVVDDGSTDGTPQLLESYGTRIHALRQANGGPEVARNKAAAVATGEYLVMLDSDDLLMPRALETYDRVIRASNPAVLIGSMFFFQDGETVSPPAPSSKKIEFWTCADYMAKDVLVGLSNSRIILRKSLLQEVGGLRDSSPQTFHLDDFHLILKVGTYGPCAIVKNPMTVAYRLHDSNSIRGVASMVNGILSLATAERSGQYPGGGKRRFARYACIGGISQLWIRKAFKLRQFKPALRLLIHTSPMLGASALKKVFSRFRHPSTKLISLDDPS